MASDPVPLEIKTSVLTAQAVSCNNDPTISAKAQTGNQVSSPSPVRIGRYRVERVLGKGGFGRVYLAFDEQLVRKVAVKVPHDIGISRCEDAALYLTEARTVANLDHPHIVPVYDVGSTPDFPLFIVSKYIPGSDLASRIKQSRLSNTHAAELTTTVAEALHYAHKQGVVHRDIKPGNILIDDDGNVFVVDFGLALREQDFGKGPGYCGTPAYMSPEQARGEGHRVDGRSDIFSLGVVLYQLLAGHRPFQGDLREELLDQITRNEARPLRQHDETIPKELERICLKALSKRASDRYSSAHDLAQDLKHFLESARQSIDRTASFVPLPKEEAIKDSPCGSPTRVAGPVSDSRPIKIVPKGLRSFDAHDADFFLELLPGPRDREGLPDSIRFWKLRIEETDPDSNFSVGLIYGPSGCGKSSLVKAGLLPRLSDQVIPVYVEATPNETESRLLHGLRRRFPDLPQNLTLIQAMAALRRGQGIPHQKTLVVIDQFEQWLSAKQNEENTELVQALRHCTGDRVQCIVMVRDDFWLAVSRFLRELEVRLVEGQNIGLIDLFDVDHARKVLAALGRSFDKLPEIPRKMRKDQNEFLSQAVSDLTQAGKVICVRLALFAEMMKDKPWTTATLKEVGGAEGIGVDFLEETFASSSANPEHRLHQKAARAVLKALLPDSGSDIKGKMRSYTELLEASGYVSRPQAFDNLVRILDSEIRLISPTDPEGSDESTGNKQSGQKYYQLTHDYLVPSLRDWLTRKQKETKRGRAELLLADRTSVWTAKQENRQLPSFFEWARIYLLAQTRNWTEPQRKMMRKAGRYHAVRTTAVMVFFALISVIGLGIRNHLESEKKAHEASIRRIEAEKRADSLVQRFLNANDTDAPRLINDLEPLRLLAMPLLNAEIEKDLAAYPTEEEKEKLAKRQANAAMASLKLGFPDRVWPLFQQSPDPRVRSDLVQRLALFQIDARMIIERLQVEPDVTSRRALVLCLGQFAEPTLSPADQQRLIEQMSEIYENEPDSGLHSAAEWLLRKWGQAARLKAIVDKLRTNETALQARKATENRQWYITTQGQTMVIVDAGELLMGSPESEPDRKDDETPYRVRIGRRIAIAAHEVTKEQFNRFQKARTDIDTRDISEWVKSDDSPQVRMTWFEAAAYCNWLSEMEGIDKDQWFYEPNASGKYEAGMKVCGDYSKRTGFRLPSEAEWEFTCRAKTSTSRYYGISENLLRQYAWYSNHAHDRTWPVGTLKPNDFGLFDMLGNSWEWCDGKFVQNVADEKGSDDDNANTQTVIAREIHGLRGGSFFDPPQLVRSAHRSWAAQTNRHNAVGFRVARTYP